MERISIIMPAYNAERFLKRSIESIIRQSYSEWELLIVDDGSIDQSVEICRKYVSDDARIRLIQNEHGGTALARNTAIDQATGEYLAFIDADDVYHPAYLQSMLEAIQQTGAEISVCGIARGTDSNQFVRTDINASYQIIDMPKAFERMYNGEWPLFITPCNKLYARRLFETVSFPAGRYFEDAATVNLLLYNSERVCVTETPLYYYYVTPNSSSVTKRSIELQDREWALRSHWEFFFQQGRKDLAYLALPFYLEELISIYHRIEVSDCPQDCQLIRKRFEDVYSTYKNKIIISEKRNDRFLAFRHPVIHDIRRMIREDGVIRTIWGFLERKIKH